VLGHSIKDALSFEYVADSTTFHTSMLENIICALDNALGM